MHLRVASLGIEALLLLGCSDGSGPTLPEPGLFQARLSGARAGALSGSSQGSVIYLEEAPDGRFTIQMYAVRADTLRSLGIDCPGLTYPAPGTYAIGIGFEDCRGSYGRFASGTTEPERATATSGSVTVTPLSDGHLGGTFRFEGILVVGADSVGTLAAAGSFNAVVLE